MDIKVLKLGVTNCFLASTGDNYLLIDTGYDYEWELFCKRLKDNGVSLSKISHIVLTHHHDDHCGLLNKILEENPDIKIVMSRRSKALLLKGKNDHEHGGGYINKRINFLLSLKSRFDKRWTHTFPPYESRDLDILIETETNLREIGIALDGRIIETPGHSIDSISILFDDGDCIVGDAAANFLQFAGTKYCVIYIENIEEYYKSWEKLISAGAQKIFPSHGRPFSALKLRKNINKNSRRNMVMIS